MPGHLLGMLESSVVLQVNRDAGRPPGVTSNGGEKTCSPRPLPNRSPLGRRKREYFSVTFAIYLAELLRAV